MDRSQRRILRLREHVLSHKYKNLVQDIEEAYDLAIKEDLENVVNKELVDLTVKELKEIAKGKDVEGYSTMKKEELIESIEGD